ncbi:hypothetical protein SteCoe_8756 [Stentor coeruleus]|uniref:Protein kinase domain-containing protein n=1 Tax=Stentor coeruleus TaxID=5963 RepID=A0A1R2CJJ9_9CILI|nr:hypothetical protein SteCoe_8756 [Stentor coeruleus]
MDPSTITQSADVPYFPSLTPSKDIFIIKNLDTGDEIDIRDENKSSFPSQLAKLLNLETQKDDIEDFYIKKRHMNNQLLQAVKLNNLTLCQNLLNTKIYKDLISKTNAKGLDDWTVLHIASSEGYEKICEVLISKGKNTDINARTTMKRTPLHLACLHGHLQVVKVLINAGADINAIDNERNSSLHLASCNGFKDLVEWLLDHGSDFTLKNSYGRTPADIAMNFEVYFVYSQYAERKMMKVSRTGYGRTAFCQTYIHNSREDYIGKIMAKAQEEQKRHKIMQFNEEKIKSTLGNEKTQDSLDKISPYDFKGLTQLGKGSFGEVFLAEKIDSGKLFAIKVLRKDQILGNNILKYAFTERNILSLINHPYIVKLNYAFQTPEKLVFVMEYCPNGDLKQHLIQEKCFSEAKARFYISEILLALEELHQHGIIFRDLKPENVVLDHEGHAKLTDFGLSKEGMAEGQKAESFCGSISYLAPEMLRKTGHDRTVDWYLLGAVLYEMLVGTPPYYSNNNEELFNNIQKGKLIFPKNISENARNLIKMLLHRDPKKRIGSGKKDSEEIKRHKFFDGVNWVDFANKKVPPPEFRIVNKSFKEVSMQKVFGRVEDDRFDMKVDEWSFLCRG